MRAGPWTESRGGQLMSRGKCWKEPRGVGSREFREGGPQHQRCKGMKEPAWSRRGVSVDKDGQAAVGTTVSWDAVMRGQQVLHEAGRVGHA